MLSRVVLRAERKELAPVIKTSIALTSLPERFNAELLLITTASAEPWNHRLIDVPLPPPPLRGSPRSASTTRHTVLSGLHDIVWTERARTEASVRRCTHRPKAPQQEARHLPAWPSSAT
jgi:hypothetical protein